MADLTTLELNINVCASNSCNSIKFYETTGTYNADDNTGGWRETGVSGHPQTSDVDTATVTITIPGDSSELAPINLFTHSFPTEDDEDYYELTNTILGLASDAKLPSGVWTFTYSVTGNTINSGDIDWTDSVTKKFYIACQEQCCVDQLGASLTTSDIDCNCQDGKFDKWIEAKACLELAYHSAECAKYNLAALYLAKVNWICDSQNCGC